MHTTPPVLSDDSLELTPLTRDDADPLHAMWTHPDVRRHLWDDVEIPRTQTEGIIDENTSLFDGRGFGLWGVRRIGDAELVGFAGLWHFRDPPELELIFGVRPNHWGRGIARRAGALVLEYAHEVLGMEEVVASTDAANVASQRVCAALGMVHTRRETLHGLDTLFYAHRRPL